MGSTVTEQRADRWRAWADAARLISAGAAGDLDAVLDRMVECAAALLGADSVAVNLAIAGTSEFVRRRTICAPDNGVELAAAGVRFGPDGILAEAMESRRPIVTLDYQADPRIGPEYRRGYPSTVVGMAVPLLAEGELVGYFFCTWDRPTTIGELDVEMAQALAEHTALAIRAARAIEAERAARQAADRLAQEARQAAVELAAVLDAALDAIHVVDTSGRLIHVNRQQRSIYMARWGRVPGSIKEWRSMMGGGAGDGPREPLAVERALAGETAERYQSTPGPDGVLHRYHVHAAPIVDEDGAVTGAVVMARDITAVHQMIEERARLDGALKTVRTVAHEMNNKLSMLTLYAHALPTLPPAASAEAAAKMTNVAMEVAALLKRFQGVVRFAETDVGGGPMLDLAAATEEAPAGS